MISWVRALVLIGVSSLGSSTACSGDDGSDVMGSHPAGTEGGACLPSDGCDVGLVCRGGKCQRADGGGTGGASGASGSSGTNGTGATGGASGSGGSSAGSGGTSSGGSSTGGSSAGGTSGGGSAGTSPGGSGGTGGNGGTGGACTGSHPIVDGGTRFCAAGQCRCEDTDTCYPTQQAARCCNGRLRCFVQDGGVACEGTHPLVDGGARFCDEQRCYCPGNDTCYPAATARACCGEAAQCR
jgi:hypothetical protein